MDTRKVTLIPAEQDFITEAVMGRIPQAVEIQLKGFEGLIERLLALFEQHWITFEGREIWFNTAVCGIFPDLDTFEPSRQNVFFAFVENRFNKSFDGYEGSLMNLMELRASGLGELPRFSKCFFAYKNDSDTMAFDPRTGETYSFNTADHHDAVLIPSVRYTLANGLPVKGEAVITVLLENGFVPKGLSEKDRESFHDLMELYNAGRGYVLLSDEGHLVFDAEKITEDISAGIFRGSINGMGFSMENLTAVSQIKADEEFTKALREKLLTCEKLRADIDAYDDRLLSDPNRGHWDLWDDGLSSCSIEISEPFIARDPSKDVCRDGVIAIDFGTRSTVVVFQRSSDHTLPMAIGTGRLSDSGKPENYENPTVMEFVNLEAFLAKYRAKEGRPETLWEQLPISHCAYSDMKLSASKDYYAFLCDIKQWAGDGAKPLRICDRVGGEYLLPPYMSDEPAEFDPVELYAYYIGLYINNMRSGIFLDYYISFPVTFEKRVREKITAAFYRGLKKSLPETVLANSELMEDFRVDGTISEPAAYAVCAMEQYGVYPKDGEEFHYGIFDFGGGTADFDFGICKPSKKRRFDYAIENLGAGGDRYLGGENLLELMAVHVFRSNYDKIAENGITFALPKRCSSFAGAAMVVASSGEAESNMRHLMESLRPLWENTEESREEFERGMICVDLFDKSGNMLPRFELNVSEDELLGIIKENIASGIDNFFAAMKLAYESSGADVPEEIGIMLAGNSCKSPLVSEIFAEKSAEGTAQMGGNVRFALYPPLGTEEAFELMESRGLDSHRGSLEYPTGKTGVAFGLIKCRKGGVIERTTISKPGEEVPFKFFIGNCSHGVFVALSDENAAMTVAGRPDYDVWYNFTDADEDTFEIYYTSRPEAVTGEVSSENVMKKKCRLPMPYEGANVYVRAVGPRTLQYTAATESGISFETYLSKLVTVELE